MKFFLIHFDKFKKRVKEGFTPSLLLKLVGVTLFILTIVAATIWVFVKLLTYIAIHFDYLVTMAFVAFVVWSLVKTMKSKAPIPESIPPASDTKAAQELETNYQLLRNCLFTVVNILYPAIKVRQPQIEAELESQNHALRQGNIILYEYVLHKTGEIAPNFIRSALEQEIDLNLSNQSFIGISQKYYYYEGHPVNLIQIHSIEDCGAYYRLRLAIANDEYCRFIKNRLNTNLSAATTGLQLPRDKDF